MVTDKADSQADIHESVELPSKEEGFDKILSIKETIADVETLLGQARRNSSSTGTSENLETPLEPPVEICLMNHVRKVRKGEIVLLFDLNGTLTTHTSIRKSSGRTVLRPGVHHLISLKV